MPALNQGHLDHFREFGFVVAEGLLDIEKDIQPVVGEYHDLLSRLAEAWHAEGRLSATYADLPFGSRLTSIMAESGQAYYQHFDISLPQAGITEDTPMHTGPAVFNLLRSPRLLDAVERFIGSEIYSNPVQHVRIKPPERLVPAHMQNALTTRTDWHQDTGVILPEGDESNILTVWLPVTEATVENGCLAVVPGSHRGELLPHCPAVGAKNQVHIPDQFLLPGAIPAEMRPGDVLFMHRQTVHSSLPNVSHDIRWSFDLRYNPIGQATGRPWFPGFIARSRSKPASELRDPADWGQLWRATRSHLAAQTNPLFNRWSAEAPYCA